MQIKFPLFILIITVLSVYSYRPRFLHEESKYFPIGDFIFYCNNDQIKSKSKPNSIIESSEQSNLFHLFSSEPDPKPSRQREENNPNDKKSYSITKPIRNRFGAWNLDHRLTHFPPNKRNITNSHSPPN